MSSEKKVNKKVKIVLIITVFLVVAVIAVLILATKTNLFKSSEQELPYKAPDEEGDNYVVYDGVKSNNSTKFRQQKKYGAYTISSATLSCEKNESNFTSLVTVEGDQNEKIVGKPVKINMLDKDRNVVNVLKAYMPDIMPGETVVLEAKINVDIVDVYDFEVVDDDIIEE